MSSNYDDHPEADFPGHDLDARHTPAPHDNPGVSGDVDHLAGAYDSLPAIVAVLDKRGIILGMRLMLYRVIRELLVNVTKHSGAHHVRVSIGIKGSCLLIRVVDDGMGFDVAASRHARGSGIRNVRKSLEACGAAMQIASVPGQGSDVQISVPVAYPGPRP